MNNYQLLIDGERMILSEDIVFAVTRKNYIFSEIDKLQASLTTTIKLVKKANKLKLNFPEAFGSDTMISEHKAVLYRGSQLLIDGVALISDDTDFYLVNIYFDNFNALKTLNNLNVQTVCGAYIQNLAFNINAITFGGYYVYFPVLKANEDFIIDNKIDFQQFLPVFDIPNLLEILHNNYTPAFYINPLKFLNKYIYGTNTTGSNIDYDFSLINQQWSGNRQTLNFNNLGNKYFQLSTNKDTYNIKSDFNIFNPSTSAVQTVNKININNISIFDGQKYKTTIKLILSVQATSNILFDAEFTLKTSNSYQPADGESERVVKTSQIKNGDNIELDLSFDTYYLQAAPTLFDYYFYLGIQCSSINPVDELPLTITIDIISSNILDNLKYLNEGTVITDFTDLLPNITFLELLKIFCQKYALVPYFSILPSGINSCELLTFEDIKNREAVDITSKIDLSKKIKVNRKIGDYSQNSIIKFANDNEAANADLPNNQIEIIFNNVNYSKEKKSLIEFADSLPNVLQNSFALCNTYKAWDKDTFEFKSFPKQIVSIQNESNLTSIMFTDGAINYSIASFINIKGEDIINDISEAYADLIQIIQNSYQLELYLLISEVEFYEFDLLTPVYLQVGEITGNFLIESINDFVPNTSTKFILTKI